jgi:hypothetical protein
MARGLMGQGGLRAAALPALLAWCQAHR